MGDGITRYSDGLGSFPGWGNPQTNQDHPLLAVGDSIFMIPTAMPYAWRPFLPSVIRHLLAMTPPRKRKTMFPSTMAIN
jgi:hypothetical protein